MYKLLIVDDETLIADGMASMIMNRQDLNIEVDKCYSAIEALRLIKNKKFDIILTDIVMPQMNGLEFLKIIKQKWPLCYVIFLTGYDDFRYVYEAIQYPNVKYLLKAEGSQKIIEVIKKLVKSIKLEKDNKIDNDSSNNISKNLQRDIMMSILIGEIKEINSELFELYKIPLDYNKPFNLCLAFVNVNKNQIDYYCKIEVYKQICFKLKNSLKKIANLFLLSYDYVNIICFLQIKDIHALKEVEKKLRSICKKYSKYNIMFLLDNNQIEWHHCATRYLLLKRLINENILLKGDVLLTEDIMRNELASNNKKLIKENTYDNSLLSACLERGEKEEFFALFDKMTKDLTDNESMHNNNLLEKYFDIATVYLACINKNNLKDKLSYKVNLYKLMRIDYHENWTEAVEYLRNLGENIFFLLNNTVDVTENEIVNKVGEYIEKNLYGDLSLSNIADYICINASYLSRLYKKKTGKKLSDYIIERKLEEAKNLLKNTNKSIQEISILLGYSSSSNFIRFFKKNIHLTPCEYREIYNK